MALTITINQLMAIITLDIVADAGPFAGTRAGLLHWFHPGDRFH